MTPIAYLRGKRDHIVKWYQGAGDFKVLQAPIGDLAPPESAQCGGE
ncbi:MAG: hypothetical protein KIT35_07750 [Piscinibacter sp.]|nr:hypothetical protein [Piscinibacter sp.]MCW5663712.1 hypothetical protein [Piscinibacter sp.]